jgi:hypothetical protein
MTEPAIGSEELSTNRRLLQGRTVVVKGGYVRVSYPRNLCSKNRAWLHLCGHPPEQVRKPRRDRRRDNPWTKSHWGDWAWSAPIEHPEEKLP